MICIFLVYLSLFIFCYLSSNSDEIKPDLENYSVTRGITTLQFNPETPTCSVKRATKCVLCILPAWSLFCSIQIYIICIFYLFFQKTSFSSFYHVCLFYFEFDVIFVNLVCNICVIIVYIGTKCFVIFSHQGTIKQEVQGLQAFAFFVVTVNDGHTKLRFKKKRRG